MDMAEIEDDDEFEEEEAEEERQIEVNNGKGISVKDYAKEINCTVQAVYQLLQKPKHKEKLLGHVKKEKDGTYLDRYAVEYLKDLRKGTHLVTTHEPEEYDSLKEKLTAVQRKVTSLNQELDQLKVYSGAQGEKIVQQEAKILEQQQELEKREQIISDQDKRIEDQHKRIEDQHRRELEREQEITNLWVSGQAAADKRAQEYLGRIDELQREQAELNEKLAQQLVNHIQETAEIREQLVAERSKAELWQQEIQKLTDQLVAEKSKGFWAKLFKR